MQIQIDLVTVELVDSEGKILETYGPTERLSAVRRATWANTNILAGTGAYYRIIEPTDRAPLSNVENN